MYKHSRDWNKDELTQLVRHIQAGDSTINKLPEACLSLVKGVCSKYYRHPLYEDIIQESLLAIASCDIYKAKEPTSFLYNIIRNAARQAIRKGYVITTHRNTPISVVSMEELNTDPSDEGGAQDRLLLDEMITAPNFESFPMEDIFEECGLTSKERQILELRMEGFTYKEIAAKVDCCTDCAHYTINSIIAHKARKHWKEY